MFNIKINFFLFLILISLINKQAIAITGEEISAKVSNWLIKEGINGKPIFSKNSSFKDCKTKIEIERIFKNYKTIRAKCLDKNGFELIMRVKTFDEVKVKKKGKPKVNQSKFFHQNSLKNKKNETLSDIMLNYYGYNLFNNEILSLAIVYFNKKAFVRNNPNYLYSGKKLYLPSVNEIKNLIIKKDKSLKNKDENNSSPTSQIYFFGG